MAEYVVRLGGLAEGSVCWLMRSCRFRHEGVVGSYAN